MSKCPNKNLEDWNDLVNMLGEDGAYYVFIKNGNKVPYLQDRGSNRFIWDVENSLGLVTWKKDGQTNRKKYKGFDRDTAADLVSKIRSEYVGDYNIARIAPDTKGEFGLKITGYPLPRAEVEMYARRYNKEKADAIRDYKLYEEFKLRAKEANEDILPPETYDQRDGIYVEGYRKRTSEERFSRAQVNALTDIMRSTMPQIEEILVDRNLPEHVVAQLVNGKTIKYNPDKLTKSTLGHEFGHLLIDLRGGVEDSFIKQGIEQLLDTPLAERINAAYPELVGTPQLQKEILAEAIGMEVADIFEAEENKTKFEKWLLRLFRWLGTRLGITKNHARQLASELLTGKPLSSKKYTGKPMQGVQLQKDLSDITDEEIEKNAVRIEGQAVINRQLTEYEKLRQRAEDIIDTRIRKARGRGAIDSLSKLENLISELQDEEVEDKRAIVQFVDNAVRQINATYRVYEDKVKQEEAGNEQAFDIKTLTRWYDILSAYDILDDVASTLLEDGFREGSATLDKSTTAKYKRILQDSIAKKNLLRDQYKKRGKEMLADSFGRHSTKVINETKELKMREWIKNNPNTSLKGEKREEAMKQYAEDYVADNINDLKAQARNIFIEQSEIASEDIGLLTRWLDTVLDSSDMMVATGAKQMVISKDNVRSRFLDIRNEMFPLVEQMYKNAGYKYLSVPPSKVYDFMLEKNTKGERTGHIVRKFSSELMEAYRRINRETENMPKATRKKIRDDWKKKNMPLDSKALNEAREKYVQSLYADGKMSLDDFSTYKANMAMSYRERFDLEDIINIDIAQDIENWNRDNSFSFRNPSKEWENPQWNELQKILKDENDPRTKFYNLVVSEIRNIDRSLPYSKRKHSELPFRIKQMDERLADGQSAKSLGKDVWEDLTIRREDDIERGQYTDENDQPIDFIPWYYNRPQDSFDHYYEYKLPLKSKKGGEQKFKTKRVVIRATDGTTAQEQFSRLVPDAVDAKVTKVKETGWSDQDQSYDLMGLYSNYFKMAYNFQEMSKILPEMELSKRLMDTRKYTVTDPKGNPIKKIMSGVREKTLTKDGSAALIVQQWDSFLKDQMYGQGKMDEGEWNIWGMRYDKAKARDLLGRYASFNMLGLNVLQGISNVSVGELTQITESIAGEFFTRKDLHKATVEYGKHLHNTLGDIGQELPTSKLGMLVDRWDILNEYEGGSYTKNSRFARMMQSSSLFFMANAGEHFLQSRVLIAMLNKVPAKNKKGEVIGTMWEKYRTQNGKLVLDPEVDTEQSNWGSEQQALFGAKVKRLLSRLHGEYSDIGKNAAQRHSIGRMGMMFRKFIVPGYKRRWQKENYNEFLETTTEGSYRKMFGFLWQGLKEMRSLGLASFSENWNTLLPREKKNIMRGVSEFTMASAVALLAAGLLHLKGEADDEKEKAVYAAAALISMRTRAEMFFFINPMETFTILKSPAVATTLIENAIKFVGHLFTPLDTYERGSWEGYPKFYKDAVGLTPIMKQYYKIKNIEDALTFFIR